MAHLLTGGDIFKLRKKLKKSPVEVIHMLEDAALSEEVLEFLNRVFGFALKVGS